MVLMLRGELNINTLIATTIAGALIGMMIAPVIMKRLNIERKILNKE